jgi:hypothetical protein
MGLRGCGSRDEEFIRMSMIVIHDKMIYIGRDSGPALETTSSHVSELGGQSMMQKHNFTLGGVLLEGFLQFYTYYLVD